MAPPNSPLPAVEAKSLGSGYLETSPGERFCGHRVEVWGQTAANPSFTATGWRTSFYRVSPSFLSTLEAENESEAESDEEVLTAEVAVDGRQPLSARERGIASLLGEAEMKQQSRSVRIAEVLRTYHVGPVTLPRTLGDDLRFRVEIVQVGNPATEFDAVVWREEHYRLRSSFSEEVADRMILVRDTAMNDGLRSASPEEVCAKLTARFAEKLGVVTLGW